MPRSTLWLRRHSSGDDEGVEQKRVAPSSHFPLSPFLMPFPNGDVSLYLLMRRLMRPSKQRAEASGTPTYGVGRLESFGGRSNCREEQHRDAFVRGKVTGVLATRKCARFTCVYVNN